MMSTFVRTPENRFNNLPNFPYQPRYVELPSSNGLRLSFIDEQTTNYIPQKSRVFLCLHGVPTYSYIYRNIIPVLLKSNGSHNNGVRVICPDFIGFGRSDKPTPNNASIHTLKFHRNSIIELISHLQITNITLMVQDWGGLIGLTLPLTVNSINRIILFNTFIPDGSNISKGFINWRNYSTNSNKKLSAGRIIHSSVRDKEKGPQYYGLTNEEKQAYNAPFINEKYQTALRIFPKMVAINPTDIGMEIWTKTWNFWKENKKLNQNNINKIQIFMAHGCRDVVFDYNIILKLFKHLICDKYNPLLGTTMEIGGILWCPNGAHFTQESKYIQWIVNKALKYFGDIKYDPVEYEWILTKDKRNNNEYTARVLKIILNCKNVHPLKPQVIEYLKNILNFAENNEYCRGIILTAFTKQRILLNKRPIFCAGLDLKTFQQNDYKIVKAYTLSVRKLWKQLHSFSKPMIGGINGDAIAGGALLGLACDYRIGYKNINIQMIESQIGLGASPSVVAQISRITGSKDIAGYVLQTAIPFRNKKALKLNLLSSVVDNEEENDNGAYDKHLMMECVNVLENEYFNGQYLSSASAKRGCRQYVIDVIDKEIQSIENNEYVNFGKNIGFLSDNVQKYINKTIKSKM